MRLLIVLFIVGLTCNACVTARKSIYTYPTTIMVESPDFANDGPVRAN